MGVDRVDHFFSQNDSRRYHSGCDRNGDEARNIHSVARVIDRSLETTPKWEDLGIQLQHPRTDCGYFQLGKRPK